MSIAAPGSAPRLGLIGLLAPRRGVRAMLGTEARLLLREPGVLLMGVLLPIVLLVIIGSLAGDHHERAYGGLRFIDVYTPVLFVFVFGFITLTTMPSTLIGYRERGYLRRLSTTPVGAGALIQAQWVLYGGVCILSAVMTTVVARLGFSVRLPSQALAFLVVLVLTAAAMLSLGTLISALARRPRQGQIMGGVLFYVMMFLAGLWIPQASMGTVLRDIGHATPLSAAVSGIADTMAGQWPPAWCVLCLIAWAALAGRLAVRTFRWE